MEIWDIIVVVAILVIPLSFFMGMFCVVSYSQHMIEKHIKVGIKIIS